MTDDAPLPDKLAHAYEQLKAAADELNAVSGELGKQISKIEATLHRLNLGVSTWVEIRGGTSDDREESFWFLEVGYAKVSSKWGVAVRTRRGSYILEEQYTDEWLFENAPRRYRAEAVEKLPDLLTKLIGEATGTIKELRDKVGKAEEIAKSFGPRMTADAQARALQAQSKAGARTVDLGAGISTVELDRAIEQAKKATGLASSGELARVLEQAHKATGLAASGELQRLIAEAQKGTGLANRGDLQHLIAEAQKVSGLATSGELARMMANAQKAVGTISASDAARALKNARRK